MDKSDLPKGKLRGIWQTFHQQVETKANRKLKSRREKHRSLWLNLATFGLVGWSVATPTLLGIALGVWIDTNFPSRYSWTLMLLIFGVLLGCLNAWYWVKKESQGD